MKATPFHHDVRRLTPEQKTEAASDYRGHRQPQTRVDLGKVLLEIELRVVRQRFAPGVPQGSAEDQEEHGGLEECFQCLFDVGTFLGGVQQRLCFVVLIGF